MPDVHLTNDPSQPPTPATEHRLERVMQLFADREAEYMRFPVPNQLAVILKPLLAGLEVIRKEVEWMKAVIIASTDDPEQTALDCQMECAERMIAWFQEQLAQMNQARLLAR